MKPRTAALGLGLFLLLAVAWLGGGLVPALMAGAVGGGVGWVFASWHQPIAIALPPLDPPAGPADARANAATATHAVAHGNGPKDDHAAPDPGILGG